LAPLLPNTDGFVVTDLNQPKIGRAHV